MPHKRSRIQRKQDLKDSDMLATINTPSAYNPYSAQRNTNTCLKILKNQLTAMPDRKLTNDPKKNPLNKLINQRFRQFSKA